MSAVLENPTIVEQQEDDPTCHCPACAKDVIPYVQGLQRVELPPAEQLVDALMRTRDWVLDPDSPKIHRHLCVKADRPDRWEQRDPCDSDATHWCAIGFFGRQLGIDNAGALCDTIAAHYYAPAVAWIWQRFDVGDYAGSAYACERVASLIRQAGQ